MDAGGNQHIECERELHHYRYQLGGSPCSATDVYSPDAMSKGCQSIKPNLRQFQVQLEQGEPISSRWESNAMHHQARAGQLDQLSSAFSLEQTAS
jgi:hypothetical protein